MKSKHKRALTSGVLALTLLATAGLSFSARESLERTFYNNGDVIVDQVHAAPTPNLVPAAPPPVDEYDEKQDTAPMPVRPPSFKERGAVFSHEAGLYKKEFRLKLSPIDGEGVVYYTTDGSCPTKSSTRQAYSEPILVTMPEPSKSKRADEYVSGVNVLTVSAVTVTDGVTSEPSTRSFVRGTDVYERFDPNMLIFSIYADPYDL
ncbi:MAG: chitobiase/beta-hexosaminidase C-terminal domain-containing protein, partial [Oscillospiraceae bacterium]|nr:chitobiase/beta-hexosaminidase C-terminal domain-containing protein [Oscillospiraceae bacterium]